MMKFNKNIRCGTAVILSSLLVMTGCAAQKSASSTSSAQSQSSVGESAVPQGNVIAGVNAENYPRVDGSTANLPLLAKIYSEVCGVSLADAETRVTISGGTGAVWRNMAEGGADILVVYEAPEVIKKEIEERGLKLDITPIGRDGLVFLVNSANKAESLTQDQLRDVYTGKTTNWGDLGGNAGEIAAFQRNEESGSQTLFLKLLMKDLEPMTPPTELRPAMMGELIDAVARYDGSGGAIGYSVYYYAKQMYENPDLKLLSVDGIAPSPETIGDGSYPLINEFYVVIREDEPADSPARKLRDWLLTSAGREAMVASGYVPAPSK